jgi:hypothetical protein
MNATFLQRSGQVLWGVFIALLPKCGLCLTTYLHLLGIMGISFGRYYELMLPLLVVLLSTSLIISFVKARRVKNYRAFILSVCGGVIILASKLYQFAPVFTWLGVGLLIVSTFFQVRLSKNSCSRNMNGLVAAFTKQKI